MWYARSIFSQRSILIRGWATSLSQIVNRSQALWATTQQSRSLPMNRHAAFFSALDTFRRGFPHFRIEVNDERLLKQTTRGDCRWRLLDWFRSDDRHCRPEPITRQSAAALDCGAADTGSVKTRPESL